MKILHHLDSIQAHLSMGSVLTIGNFDGMHLAHQAILKALKNLSQQKKLPSVVILFEPQPKEFFHGHKSPIRLMSLREKILMLSPYQIDYLCVLSFNPLFAALSKQDFIENILIKYFNLKTLIIGDDFRFGQHQSGYKADLINASELSHFELIIFPITEMNHQRISSTWLRSALESDDLITTEKLMGVPYYLCGRVIHGDGIGRKLGYPTANLLLKRSRLPIHGVYAVTIEGLENKILLGVANIGYRPTLNKHKLSAEVHILNFDQDIYTKIIKLNFYYKIRVEKKFHAIAEVAEQITQDIKITRQFFRNFKVL